MKHSTCQCARTEAHCGCGEPRLTIHKNCGRPSPTRIEPDRSHAISTRQPSEKHDAAAPTASQVVALPEELARVRLVLERLLAVKEKNGALAHLPTAARRARRLRHIILDREGSH